MNAIHKPIPFIPDYNATPGANFQVLIKKMGFRSAAAVKLLAKKMGVDPSVIANIANDEESITFSMADLLERGTGIKARFWLDMVEKCNSKS